MILIKILIFLVTLLLLALPFLPLKWPFSFRYYREKGRKRSRNYLNLICVVLAAILGIVFLPLLRNLVVWIAELKPVAWVLSKIPAYAQYATELAIAISVNIAFCLLTFTLLSVANSAAGLFSWLRELPARAKERKQKRLLRKQAKDDKDQTGEKDNAAKKTSKKNAKSPIDPQLLPAPEDKPEDTEIVLPGKLELKKAKKKKTAEAEKKDEPEKKEALLRRILNRVRGLFCEEVEESWYVRPQLRHASKHLRNFLILVSAIYLASFALLMLPALFHIRFLEEPFYKLMQGFARINYLYPAFALSLLTEIFWILNGKAAPIKPTEADEDPGTQQQGRVVRLDELETDLMKVMGKSYEVSSFFSSDLDMVSFDRTVVELSDSPILQDVADYVRSQNLELNQEYLLGIKHFQDGRDVLFHAPLYTAVGTYLFAVLNLRITQGERMVVVCHNKSEIPNVIDTMQRGFLRVNRTHKPLWRIVGVEDFRVDAEEDVLVLTPEEFQSKQLFSVHETFFRQVTVAFFPDANLVVSANNYYCQIIAQRLTQNCKKGLQFLFLSTRNTENLDNYLTEYFLLPKTPENARGDYGYGDSHIYVWRAKKDAAAVIDNAGQTMLPEVTIGNIASQHGIPTPTVISDGAIYSNQVNTEWLELYDATDRPLGFAVVSDDCCNLPSVIYAYSRYLGKKASVIHVLTRQYLLRNYFYAHAPRYLFEEPLMQRSMTKHAEPEKTRMVLLLCRLIEGLPLSSFVTEMHRILGDRNAVPSSSLSFDEISALVDQCLAVTTGTEPSETKDHFMTFFPERAFYPEPHIRIREAGDVLSRLLRETALVQLHFEGAREPAYLNLFTRMVDQRYLEEQNLIYQNRNYRILRVDRENGVIYVADASSTHGIAREYVQLRSYSMADGERFQQDCAAVSEGKKPQSEQVKGLRLSYAGEENAVSGLVLARSEGAFRVCSDTLGYYMLGFDGGSVRQADDTITTVWLHEGQRETLRRTVDSGLYLRIDIKRERDDRLTMTLAALLQELMKTLFPDVYFCLSVCPILENPEQIYESPDFRSATIASLYPQLKNWGPVRAQSIELLIVEDCVGGTGALELLTESNATFLRNALWMLSDYLEWQKDNEPSPYIFFGLETQPGIFDLDGLRSVLQGFAHNYVREHDVRSQLDASNRCTLCGKRLDVPYLWHGRQMICKECSEAYVPNPEEAAQILDYARDYLIETFSVTLPELQLELGSLPQEDSLSALDLEQGIIYLAEELPLRVAHVQIMTQLVRCWQMENLDITGDELLDGQPLYVVLQYLRHLEQHRYARLLHRDYLLCRDDASSGYCRLLQALQTEKHDNSFLYLLQQGRKGTTPPVKRYVKKNSTRVPGNTRVSYYYRSTLSMQDAAIYDALLDGYLAQRETIELSALNANHEQLKAIHTCLMKDHPEIFWSNGAYEYKERADGQVISLSPAYTVSPETRQTLQQEIDAAVEPFLEEITDEMDDYEVALKLYEKLIEFLDYDTLALERQERRSRSERLTSMDDLRNIYGAIVRHRSVCAGYAKGYQYLLQRFGIEALYVTGECHSEGLHAWNIVRLEGDYYHVDVTWGDYSNTDPSKNRKGMSYAYFAITDTQIRQSRSIEASPAPPSCTSESCNYYTRNGLYFTRYDPKQVMAVLVEKLKAPDGGCVELRFENAKLLRDAEFFLCKNGGIFEAARAAGLENRSFSHSVREELCLLKIFVDD